MSRTRLPLSRRNRSSSGWRDQITINVLQLPLPDMVRIRLFTPVNFMWQRDNLLFSVTWNKKEGFLLLPKSPVTPHQYNYFASITTCTFSFFSISALLSFLIRLFISLLGLSLVWNMCHACLTCEKLGMSTWQRPPTTPSGYSNGCEGSGSSKVGEEMDYSGKERRNTARKAEAGNPSGCSSHLPDEICRIW